MPTSDKKSGSEPKLLSGGNPRIPDVHKAVKWNQPFYGHGGEGWSWIEQASNRPGEKM